MKELVIFRNTVDGLLYYIINGVPTPVALPLNIIQDDIFKIPHAFDKIRNTTPYKIISIATTDNIPTFQLQRPVIAMGGGSRRTIINNISGGLLHVRATLTSLEVSTLGTTPVSILSLGTPDEIVIIQTNFKIFGTVPYTVGANNVLGLYTDLVNKFPQVYSDILESTQRSNLYPTMPGQPPPATTSQTGSGDLTVGMFDTTTGAQTAINPTLGDSAVQIDVWYVINVR